MGIRARKWCQPGLPRNDGRCVDLEQRPEQLGDLPGPVRGPDTRLHESLGDLPPAEFEAQELRVQAALQVVEGQTLDGRPLWSSETAFTAITEARS
jgi:hypothetical protein